MIQYSRRVLGIRSADALSPRRKPLDTRVLALMAVYDFLSCPASTVSLGSADSHLTPTLRYEVILVVSFTFA